MICGGGGSWDSKPDADVVNRCEDLVLNVVSCSSFVTTSNHINQTLLYYDWYWSGWNAVTGPKYLIRSRHRWWRRAKLVVLPGSAAHVAAGKNQ